MEEAQKRKVHGTKIILPKLNLNPLGPTGYNSIPTKDHIAVHDVGSSRFLVPVELT